MNAEPEKRRTEAWNAPPSWRTAWESLSPENPSSIPTSELAFLAEKILSLLAAETQTLFLNGHYFPSSMGLLVLTLLNSEVIYMFMTMKYHRKKNEESEAKGEARGAEKTEARFLQWFEENKERWPQGMPPPPFQNGHENGS